MITQASAFTGTLPWVYFVLLSLSLKFLINFEQGSLQMVWLVLGLSTKLAEGFGLITLTKCPDLHCRKLSDRTRPREHHIHRA